MAVLISLYIIAISLSFGMELSAIKYGKTCNVTDYGAKGDNKTYNTKFIQSAINDCTAYSNKTNSMSLVVLPSLSQQPTIYLSGAIFLDSNIAFYIEQNAVLLGIPFNTSNDVNNVNYPEIYTRVGGIMQYLHSSLLNGGICLKMRNNSNVNTTGDQCETWKKLHDVIIYGYGTINCNGNSGWYNQTDRPLGVNLMWIENLNIFNVTITNSPSWTLRPLFCNNIFIENITINCTGPNTDGFDPDSCSNILMQFSYISSDDDHIAIKSGKDQNGRDVGIPSTNITIQHMILANGNGASIGSEMSGNVTNVLFNNLTFTGPYAKHCVRIKSEKGRGGMVKNITYKNINFTNGGAKMGISITEDYAKNATGIPPIFEDFYLYNIFGNAKLAGEFHCLQESPCTFMEMDNVDIQNYSNAFSCNYAYGNATNVTPNSCLNSSNPFK
eukprot:481739_1